MEIKAIASLISIYLHLQKLSIRLQLRTFTLSSNHTIKFLFEKRHIISSHLHQLLLENITSNQCLKIKSSVTDTNNHLNRIFPSFHSLNSELSPGSRLINIFSSYFSFYKADCYNKKSKAAYCHNLDNLVFNTLSKSQLCYCYF